MLFSVSVHHGRRFCLITCVGRSVSADWYGALSFAGTVSARAGHTRMLLDMLGVDLDLTPEERGDIGTFASHALAHCEKTAAVLPAVLYTGEGERCAQERALKVRNILALDPAMKWLVEGI